MNQESIVSKLREDLDILTNEYSVEKIGIFGSYANNSNNDDSDIDLVVNFKKPIGFKYFELIEFLEKKFGKKIDIITDKGLNGIRVSNVEKSIEESVIYV